MEVEEQWVVGRWQGSSQLMAVEEQWVVGRWQGSTQTHASLPPSLGIPSTSPAGQS